MATNRLMQRNNLADAFIPVGDEATNQALAEARAQVGDAEWKKGFTPETKKIVRDTLKAHGVRYEERLQGRLLDVQTAETQANGETFNKLRVTLEHDGGKTILSADMDSEFAQRLVTKLDAASKEHAGQEVTIGGFAKPVERDGRAFVDHVAIMKDSAGQEISAAPGHFEAAKAKILAAQEPLRAANMPDKTLKQVAKATREQYFKEVADSLHGRFVEQGIAPKAAEREQYPALEAGVKDVEGNWHNLSLHEKEGKLVGTMQRRDMENGGYEKVPLVFEKTDKGLEATAAFGGDPLTVTLSKSEPTQSGLEKVDVTVSRFGDPIHEHPGRLRENAALQQIPNHREGKIIQEALGVDPQMLKPYSPQQSRAQAPTQTVEKEKGEAKQHSRIWAKSWLAKVEL